MTAPTLRDYADSTFTGTGTSEVTADLDWAANGDLAVALIITEDNGVTAGTPTATGLTFSAISGSPTNAASSCKGYGFSATASGDGNSALTSTLNSNQSAGMSAWAYGDHGGLGGIAIPAPAASAVASVTVQGPDSSVLMALGDWNATTDVTVTTTPAGGTVRQAVNISGNATFLVVEWANQAAGTRNYGVTAWTGTGTITRVAVEVKGLAGGGATDLVVADAVHAAAADAPALTQVHALTVADATHTAVTDAPALAQVHALTVADATHTAVTDAPALAQVHNLAVLDAVHAPAADTVALAQVHNLAVADAVHAAATDTVTLSTALALTVADAVHAAAADTVSLAQVHELAVADAVHAAAADAPTLTQAHSLVVLDAVHAVVADLVTLDLVGDEERGSAYVSMGAPEHRVLIDARERRVILASQADRITP